jgi:hypothetical protein
MPRKELTCVRPYRDRDGTVQRCGGPMRACIDNGTWTCSWCGRTVPIRDRRR